MAAIEHSISDHDLRKEIKIIVKMVFLFFIKLFRMMQLLAILQVKAGKTMIKESCSTR